MALPVAQGLSVLYVLADQWKRERDTVAALGVVEGNELDELVARRARRADVAERREQLEAMGGEVIG
jgi:hypothetical protein